MTIYKKMRLDRILVERGLAVTRSRAADLVRLGAVSVEGQPALKPGALLEPDASLIVDAHASPFVSRGGLKLAAALDAFGLDPKGRIALDIGASTGGFTEVLLARGAARVFAVDVGREPAARQASRGPAGGGAGGDRREEPRCGGHRRPCRRHRRRCEFHQPDQGACRRRSSLAAPGAWLVALVKPQFEAGREAVGKGGIVRDAQARARAVAEVRAFIDATPGWKVFAEMPSPIPGGSGNEEVLIGARHGA